MQTREYHARELVLIRRLLDEPVSVILGLLVHAILQHGQIVVIFEELGEILRNVVDEVFTVRLARILSDNIVVLVVALHLTVAYAEYLVLLVLIDETLDKLSLHLGLAIFILLAGHLNLDLFLLLNLRHPEHNDGSLFRVLLVLDLLLGLRAILSLLGDDLDSVFVIEAFRHLNQLHLAIDLIDFDGDVFDGYALRQDVDQEVVEHVHALAGVLVSGRHAVLLK